jgi:hypothetical protein
MHLPVSVLATVLAAGCAASEPAAPSATIERSYTRVPEPSAAPDRSPAPAPWTEDVETLAWHRLGRLPAEVSGVVGFEDGYVALADGGDRVFFSPDGQDWQKVRLPSDGGSDPTGLLGRALATDGNSVLVVGGYSHEPCETLEPGQEPDTGGGPECDYSPVTWVSDDGVDWRASFPEADTAEFVAAWPVAGGGWDAAASEWYGVCLGGQELWHSDDGLAWAQQKVSPPAPWEGYDPAVPLGVASDSGHSLLAASERGSSFETTLAARADGGPWRVVNGFPGGNSLVIAGTAPAGKQARWVLGGLTYDESGCNPEEDGDLCGVQTPTVWSSSDGTDWTTSVLAVGSGVPSSEPGDPETRVTQVTSLVRTGRGYVAVGAVSRHDGARHETWVSGDGIAWTRLPQPDRPTFDLGPGLVAAGPMGVIGISATREGGEASIWELR